ncbi:unnamed protein product [Rodentolepis nana]|uniref:Tubulin polyglutamylase TTLL4 n=1 Tax=Rodentolepis nana TaxID=102285 RepID=A0A0R3TDZ1_RODNA|nr:unnamed protein product [Rodentolepis nana]
MFCPSPYNVQELYGFDIILDENLKPWLLEVNISPSLNIDSELDFKVKDKVVVDMLNLTGIHLPSESDISRSMSELIQERHPQPSGACVLRKTTKRSYWAMLSDECPPPSKIQGSRRSSTDNKKPPAPTHPWHLDCRIIQSKLGPDEVSKQNFYESRSLKRKGRAVRQYKSTYSRTPSLQPLPPSTPNLLESNYSEASTSSSQTVSQGTDPESANFDAYLKVVEERKRLAQLKRDVKNSPYNCPWLKSRISVSLAFRSCLLASQYLWLSVSCLLASQYLWLSVLDMDLGFPSLSLGLDTESGASLSLGLDTESVSLAFRSSCLLASQYLWLSVAVFLLPSIFGFPCFARQSCPVRCLNSATASIRVYSQSLKVFCQAILSGGSLNSATASILGNRVSRVCRRVPLSTVSLSAMSESTTVHCFSLLRA